MGKMIDAGSVVVASTAMRRIDHDCDILRRASVDPSDDLLAMSAHTAFAASRCQSRVAHDRSAACRWSG